LSGAPLVTKKENTMADNKVKASDHPDYAIFTFLAIFFPYIAILAGAYLLTKQEPLDKKLGEHAIAFGTLFLIVGAVLYATVITQL
jgi:prolipoprotein diacylglyceryltransferase